MTTSDSIEFSALINLLRASGASYLECMVALQAHGLEPREAFQAFHGALGDPYATVLCAAELVDNAPNDGHRPDIDWLAEALLTLGIHPYSVECSASQIENHGWWRDRAEAKNLKDLPSRELTNIGPGAMEVTLSSGDLTCLGPAQLVFPHGIKFLDCHLPDRFPGGLRSPRIYISNGTGLVSMEGVHLTVERASRYGSNGYSIESQPNLTLSDMPDLEALPPDQENFNVLIIKGCNRLEAIPDLNVSGIMLIQDCASLPLPQHLHVGGNLWLRRLPQADRWPKDFSCGGSIQVVDCPHLSVPLDVAVKGDVELVKMPMTESLLAGRKTARGLGLAQCSGDTIPNGICVKGQLELALLTIESLPSDLQFHDLLISECLPLRLEHSTVIPGRFKLLNGTLETLAPGLRVEGDRLELEGCHGTSLPTELQVSGDLWLKSLYFLETLPSDIDAKAIHVWMCPRLRIPRSLEHRMNVKIHGT